MIIGEITLVTESRLPDNSSFLLFVVAKMTSTATHHTYNCKVCQRKIDRHEMSHSDFIRPVIQELIKKDFPQWDCGDVICRTCLTKYRADYIEDILQKERGELSQIEQQVIASLAQQATISKNLNTSFDENLSFGDKISDKIANFGGSWRFIISFCFILAIWITLNSIFRDTFDPFPFILLNLLLSCIAALQAPVIMMSQNRQEAKDRLRSEHDYRINLKAELEIQHLNLKLDQLLTHQWERLLEVQRIQMELLEELTSPKTKTISEKKV